MLRRLSILSALVGLAAMIVIAAVAISSSGSDAPRRTSTGRDVTSIMRGIPQHGITLGDPRAAVLLVEFADPQCPFCREFAVSAWPEIIKKYVRTGKLRMEVRFVDFLGKDSTRAARVLQAAGEQNRLWEASARFYDVQGDENSGYVTDQFLREVLGGVPGLDVDQVLVDRGAARAREELGAAKSLLSRYAVTSTPSLLIGSDNTDLRVLSNGVMALDKLRQAIDAELLTHI